jgi:hypothetical protein
VSPNRSIPASIEPGQPDASPIGQRAEGNAARLGVAGERELRGEALVGRCCRAALIFGPHGNAAQPFLESAPETGAEGDPASLNEPETKERKFEGVVKSTEPAAVLVLVY